MQTCEKGWISPSMPDLRCGCGSCQSERIAELEQQVADLQKDRARLEWLVMQDENIQRSNSTLLWYMEGYGCSHKDNWRDAIDAAMNKEGML